jgi:hypothetical protein
MVHRRDSHPLSPVRQGRPVSQFVAPTTTSPLGELVASRHMMMNRRRWQPELGHPKGAVRDEKENHCGSTVGGSHAVFVVPDDDDDEDRDQIHARRMTKDDEWDMTVRDDIPAAVVVVVSVEEWESRSDISIETFVETRTLSQNPSLDGPTTMTARDFHYLFLASQQLEDQDWPSGEDRDPPTVCEEIILSTLTDMGETSKRSKIIYGEI